MLLAAMVYFHQALMLWYALGLHLINCRLYCPFLAALKVVEEEKEEVVKKNKSLSTTVVRSLGQHYPCRG